MNILREVLIEPLIYYVWIEDMMFSPGSNNTRIACVGTTAVLDEYNEDVYAAVFDTSLNVPPPISVQPISNVITNEFRLFQNYPNPFNPKTKIRFAVAKTEANTSLESTRLSIYDILGKEIDVLLNEELSAGIYEIEWNAEGYPSGVYFARLTSGNKTVSGKIILLK